jgi:hypothetical protein
MCQTPWIQKFGNAFIQSLGGAFAEKLHVCVMCSIEHAFSTLRLEFGKKCLSCILTEMFPLVCWCL